MNIQEFRNLKKGNLVFYVSNSGTAGISKYQYIGAVNCHATNENKHVFISPYLLSTTLVTVGMEKNSRTLKSLFLTEKEAIKYHKNLID